MAAASHGGAAGQSTGIMKIGKPGSRWGTRVGAGRPGEPQPDAEGDQHGPEQPVQPGAQRQQAAAHAGDLQHIDELQPEARADADRRDDEQDPIEEGRVRMKAAPGPSRTGRRPRICVAAAAGAIMPASRVRIPGQPVSVRRMPISVVSADDPTRKSGPIDSPAGLPYTFPHRTL